MNDRTGQYERLKPLLEREIIDKLPQRDSGVYLDTDPQNYFASPIPSVLSALSAYLSTFAPPSAIPTQKFKDVNFAIPRINLALEAVILIAKQDSASEGFSWDAARKSCDELKVAYPETENEAIDLQEDFIYSLRESAEVCSSHACTRFSPCFWSTC